jgi:hypothetical protein
MSNDAEDVSFIITVSQPVLLSGVDADALKTLFWLYGAPFELGIGSVFLYQLLVRDSNYLAYSILILLRGGAPFLASQFSWPVGR